jgi:hypothetical protein
MPAGPDDYYKDAGTKILDFFAGFFGVCLLIGGGVAAVAYNKLPGSWTPGLIFAGAVLAVAAIALFFVAGRRYIALGMIAVLIVPALVLGACALFLLGSRH